ncbi:hypothetical protein ES705_22630 [subsurface metagenome]
MRKRTKEFYERMNRVADNLAKTDLSQNDNKYCWVLFRKTFLYGKYEDLIKRDLMARLTGMAGTTVSDIKKRLLERNIIHANASVIGFNLNTDQWEKVKVSLPFKKVKVSLPKGQGRAEEKGQGIVTLQRNYKEISKEGGVGLKKLSYKEADKLEGKEWLKQVMWQRGEFTEKFIDEIFEIYSFEQCYDAYLAYQNAHNVRFKESWLMAKLQRGPEPEE